jgi:hypothetical protein
MITIFCDFRQFFGENIGVFLKNQCYDQFFSYFTFELSQKRQFFREIFFYHNIGPSFACVKNYSPRKTVFYPPLNYVTWFFISRYVCVMDLPADPSGGGDHAFCRKSTCAADLFTF